LFSLKVAGAKVAVPVKVAEPALAWESMMNRLFARWAALVGTAATLALTSAGAFAQATITLSDNNCLSFSLTGTPPNQVLTCNQSSTPLCTISGPAAGTIGSPITLTTIACVPAATTYAWTGGNCNGITTKNCTDPGTGYTNQQPVAYTVTGTNAAGAGPPSNTVNVTWNNTPPAAPSGCSISGAPSGTQTAGVQVTLTINCTGGGPATAWAWTGGGAQGMTTQTTTPITVNTTTTFTATASNAGGTSAPAGATVTIGGSGTISCSGMPSTLVENMAWDTAGSPYTVAYTYNTGGFAGNGALVVVFTTPSVTTPPTSGKGNIGTVEFSGPPAERKGSLSTTPCDFTTGIIQPNVPSTVFDTDEPTIYFTLGYTKTGYLQLQPNTTYYWNEKTTGCSPGPTCDVKITLTKQPGT
jgi:hypothetical protein